MEKGFGELFSESWREYKINFKYFLFILFLFILIPTLINYFVSITWGVDIVKLGENPGFENILKVVLSHLGVFVLSVLSWILGFLLAIFCYVAILSSILDKKAITLKQSLNSGKKNFFRYLGFSIVVTIFSLGLFLLFIIPGIIFTVFWCFSAFIFIKERKGIIDSLRDSYVLVRGKWWKTFGFIILFFLITVVLSLAVSFLVDFINLIINPIGTSSYYSNVLWYVNDLISLFGEFVINLICLPLGFLFMKNFYLDRKK